MDQWESKVAVVTGASSGIGEAIAKALAAHGMKVAALARRYDRLENLVKETDGCKGEVKAIQCDVSKEGDVASAFRTIADTWGGIHVIVNNAGVLVRKPLHLMEDHEVKKMFETNVYGGLNTIREGTKIMMEKQITHAHIININSTAGHRCPPYAGYGGYVATKFALTALTESLRKELHMVGGEVKVTSLSPGVVDTEMTSPLLPNYTVSFPILMPSAIADAVIYVLSTPPSVNVTELTIRPTGDDAKEFNE